MFLPSFDAMVAMMTTGLCGGVLSLDVCNRTILLSNVTIGAVNQTLSKQAEQFHSTVSVCLLNINGASVLLRENV